MSIVQRTLDDQSYNINVLSLEIAKGVDKFVAIEKYDYGTHIMDIEVSGMWRSLDDAQLDAIIAAHDPGTRLPGASSPVPLVFGGSSSGWISNVGALSMRANFVYPGGEHALCYVRFANSSTGNSRVVLKDVDNNVDIFDTGMLTPAVGGAFETLIVKLPEMPIDPTVFEVWLESSSGGTDCQVAGLTFV